MKQLKLNFSAKTSKCYVYTDDDHKWIIKRYLNSPAAGEYYCEDGSFQQPGLKCFTRQFEGFTEAYKKAKELEGLRNG